MEKTTRTRIKEASGEGRKGGWQKVARTREAFVRANVTIDLSLGDEGDLKCRRWHANGRGTVANYLPTTAIATNRERANHVGTNRHGRRRYGHLWSSSSMIPDGCVTNLCRNHPSEEFSNTKKSKPAVLPRPSKKRKSHPVAKKRRRSSPSAKKKRKTNGVHESEDTEDAETKAGIQEALATFLMQDLQRDDHSAAATAAADMEALLRARGTKACEYFFGLGGQEMLQIAINKWGDRDAIRKNLLPCLLYICRWAQEHNHEDALSSIVTLRGLDTALETLQKQLNLEEERSVGSDCDNQLVPVCVSIVSELCHHEAARNALERHGGICLVLKTMRCFPNNDDIQEGCCHLITTFCRLKAHVDKMKEMKGEAIGLIAAAVQTFPEHERLNRATFSSMKAIGAMCGY